MLKTFVRSRVAGIIAERLTEGQIDWKSLKLYLRSKEVDMHEKRRALQKLWDVLPTHAWMHKHGWQTDGRCQCGEGEDTLEHRRTCWLYSEIWGEVGPKGLGSTRPGLEALVWDGKVKDN